MTAAEGAATASRSVVIGNIDPAATLRSVLMLPNDPTVSMSATRFERATLTPDGPASIRVDWGAADQSTEGSADGTERSVVVTAWGPGGSWLVDRADGLLGIHDDVSGFDPKQQPLRDVWRRQRNRRITKTATLWHDLAWFIVQQRVTTVDASQQWRALVNQLGQPAPGPVALHVPPEPETLARMHYTEYHRFGIERQRGEHLRGAARLASRFADQVDGPSEVVTDKLATVRGIGPWTRSCLATLTWGEADAVIVGDDGIPSMVTWFLAREERGDDTRMLDLLEPFRPHRGRVIQLAFASGQRPPRRHHRYARNPIRHR